MLTRVPPPLVVSAGANTVTASGSLVFSNSNGIGFGLNGSTVTASHNALTTARASTDALGLNTAQTNVTWTANSSGLSLDAGGYAGTGFTSTTTAGTQVKATNNTAGLSLAVPAFITTAAAGGAFSAGVSTGGNTAGDTGVTGSRLVFVGNPNITLSQATDANGATITFSGGAGAAGNTGFISAGAATASLGTVVFSNSNNVSFGVNGQTVTGSVAGSATSVEAVASASSVGTVTRYALEDHRHEGVFSVGVTNAGNTAGNTRVGAGRFVLQASNSLTLSQQTAANGLNTIHLQVGAYLTTAALSGDTSKYVQAWELTGNTAGTTSSAQGTKLYFEGGNSITVSGTSNTIKLSVGAYLTTADLSANSSNYFRNWKLTGNTAGTTSSQQGTDFWLAGGNGVTVSGSSNTISLSVATNYQSQGAYLTTADLSQNSSKYVQNWKLTGNTAGTTSSAQGTDLWLAGGNGITVSGSSNTISFSVGSYITTARASTDAVGLNTAKTNVTWTVNSSGLSLDAGGYAGTGFTSTTTAGTEVKATLNTAGLSMAVPAYITTAAGAAFSAGMSTAGNTSGDTAFVTGRLALVGGNNITLSGSTNGGSMSLTISAPNLGAGAMSAGASNLGNTAGDTGITGTQLVLVGSGVMSLSQSTGANGGTLSILAPATSSLSATGAFSISTNGSTISMGVAPATLYAAGNTFGTSSGSADIRTVSLVGDAGVQVAASNSGWVVRQPYLSYYCNVDQWGGMVTSNSAITQTSGSSIFVQPFQLHMPVSASYLRLLASFNDSVASTAGTTSNNGNYSCDRYTTYAAVLYSQGTGANSRSLQSVTSTSVGMTGRTIYSGGANGSNYTITLQKTYPVTGGTSSYTTSYAVSSASIVISSNSNTLFTGPRFLDVPFAASLSPGAWWLGVGASTSSLSQTSHISFAGAAGLPISLAGLSQTNVSVGLLGAATSASDHQLLKGLGVWTTNAAVLTKDSIGLGQVSQVASNPVLPFQFIREA